MNKRVFIALAAIILSFVLAACNKQEEAPPVEEATESGKAVSPEQAVASPTLYRTVTAEAYQGATREERLLYDLLDAAVNALRVVDSENGYTWEAGFVFSPEGDGLFANTLIIGPASATSSPRRNEPGPPPEDEKKETCRACNEIKGAICAKRVVEKAKAQKDKTLAVEVTIDKEGCVVMKY